MKLVPLDPTHLAAYIAGNFQPLIDVTGRAPVNLDAVSPVVREIAKAYRDLYARHPASRPWLGYLALSDHDEMIGTCGFKAPPDAGSVEIAYFTFTEFEGQGLGRRMAARLVALASQSSEVVLVTAHTMRNENASTRILRSLGFALKGTVLDPEDGPVWRWHLKRAALAA
jgi:ribosomal-protein-alanine N-acetyltransferase